jgi:hypothetical protein
LKNLTYKICSCHNVAEILLKLVLNKMTVSSILLCLEMTVSSILLCLEMTVSSILLCLEMTVSSILLCPIHYCVQYILLCPIHIIMSNTYYCVQYIIMSSMKWLFLVYYCVQYIIMSSILLYCQEKYFLIGSSICKLFSKLKSKYISNNPKPPLREFI